MLKRYQVLINEWLADHIKDITEKYDVSFSEAIRLTLCVEFGRHIAKRYPKYKYGITEEEIARMSIPSEKSMGKQELEKRHKFISKVYFEARKAIEYAREQEKKSKKK